MASFTTSPRVSRDDLEPALLLQPQHVADRGVLCGAEGFVGNLLLGMLAERPAQGLRPQQAADMVGLEWRAAVRFDAHAL